MAEQSQNPQVKGGVVPYLTVDGAIKAAEFYKKAFAAQSPRSIPPDEKGRTMHAHLYINGSSVMLSDAYPEHGHPLTAPASSISRSRSAIPTNGSTARSRPAAPR